MRVGNPDFSNSRNSGNSADQSMQAAADQMNVHRDTVTVTKKVLNTAPSVVV